MVENTLLCDIGRIPSPRTFATLHHYIVRRLLGLQNSGRVASCQLLSFYTNLFFYSDANAYQRTFCYEGNQERLTWAEFLTPSK